MYEGVAQPNNSKLRYFDASMIGIAIDWEALRTVVRTRTAPIDLFLSKAPQLALCPPPFMLILTNRGRKIRYLAINVPLNLPFPKHACAHKPHGLLDDDAPVSRLST